MKTRIAIALLSMALSTAHATLPGNASDEEIKIGLIETAASMSEQTLNCGLSSAKDVQEGRTLQRNSFPAHMGLKTAEYDRIYARALADFRQKWAAMSASQREKTCKQTHILNKD